MTDHNQDSRKPDTGHDESGAVGAGKGQRNTRRIVTGRPLGRRLVGRGVDTLLDGLVFWPAAGLFACAVARSYSPTTGLVAYAGLVVVMAAAAVADVWLASRRRRPAVSTDLERLSVYIDSECAVILRAVTARRRISTTEAVWRAVGLLGQSENVAVRPASADGGNPSRGDLNGAVRQAQEAVNRLSHADVKPGRVDGTPNGRARSDFGRWN